METYSLHFMQESHRTNRRGEARILLSYFVYGISKNPKFLDTGIKVPLINWDKEQRKVVGLASANSTNKVLDAIRAKKDMLLMQTIRAGYNLDGNEFDTKRVQHFKAFALSLDKAHGEEHYKKLEAYMEREPQWPDLNPTSLRTYQMWLQTKYVTKNNTKLKANSVYQAMNWVRTVINTAIKEEVIRNNPLKGFEIIKKESSTPDFFLPEEQNKLLEAMKKFEIQDKSDIHTGLVMILYGIYTGLRFSDWDKYDASRVYEHNGKMVFNLRAQKNKAAVHIVAHPKLLDVLERLPFIEIPGDVTDANYIIRKAIKAAGLSCDGTTHKGRHTMGFNCARLGMSVSMCAAILAIDEKTAEVYYHLIGAHLTEQSAVLQGV